MTFCYCCIYAECVGRGSYMCQRDDALDFGGKRERCDVSSCDNYDFDDQTISEECYLKDICGERVCEGCC